MTPNPCPQCEAKDLQIAQLADALDECRNRAREAAMKWNEDRVRLLNALYGKKEDPEGL